MPTRPRPGLLLTALLAVLLLASACADIDRTVVRKHRSSDNSGRTHHTLTWESSRYPDFEAPVSEDCWAGARVGATVPDGCVSPASTIIEGNPYRANEALALLGSLIAIGILLVVAFRRVARRPTVLPEPVAVAVEVNGAPAAEFVQLMRAVNTEKDAQTVAGADGHDLPRPGLVGAGIGLGIVIFLALAIG